MVKRSSNRSRDEGFLAEAERLLRNELLRTAQPPRVRRPSSGDHQPDLVVTAGAHEFDVEWKSNAQYATVRRAVDQLRARARGSSRLPLLGVPYMPPASAEICSREGVSWFDLSGNAEITAPGVLVRVRGRPNRYRRRGRPSSVFAPKSSRIARALLSEPGRRLRQQELADETGLDAGYVSRIVRRLVESRFVARDEDGAVQVSAPRSLLDAWRAENPFARENVLRCHVPARSGEEALDRIAQQLRATQVEHAFTGLAAAWLQAPFAAFRIVTAYVVAPSTEEIAASIGARVVDSGANLWLVVPRDSGVFLRAPDASAVRCVHPVQTCVDLAGHPERSEEAAERLREQTLPWTLTDE